MSAIGGIVDFKNSEVDFGRMNTMRLSMALRGRRRSAAFLCGGVGMFFNDSTQENEDNEDDRQPSICERRGMVSALCMDASGFSASAVLERYMVYGTELLGLIEGSFALALYDGERDMLILARDKRGRKPLFYRIFDGRIFFASEVKGLLDGVGVPPRVSREALQLHLTSPMGVYRATNIYPDVREVLPGECLLFTKMGMSRFFYREKRDSKPLRPIKVTDRKEKIICAYPSLDLSELDEYLREALIAFDYPQFDCFMPSVIEMIYKAHEQGKTAISFEDGVRRKNLAYAYEREDRLGSMYNVECIGVLPRGSVCVSRESLRDMEESLQHRIFSMRPNELELLRSVLGEYKLKALIRLLGEKTKKIEDTEQRIRTLGMLCQTVEWMQAQAPVIDDESRIYCAQSV